MTLSTTMIVGHDGELESLKRAVDSFYDFTDEIIITANGKETKKIEEWCKTLPKIQYFYHEWKEDFSDQRNFCASKIRPDADYYYWVDADDVVIGADMLRSIAITAKKRNLDAVFFTYWYGCLFDGEPSLQSMKKVELTQMRERLIRPGKMYWKKRIHETPVPIENIEFLHSEIPYTEDYPVVWLHLGVARNMPIELQIAKTKRNREMLEMELEDERKIGQPDPRTLLYLMKIYAESDEEDILLKCLEMGNEYLLLSGWDAERALCSCIMGRCLGKLGKEREAKDFLFKAIKEYPYDPMLYLHLSRACYNLGQYREMKHWLEFALTLDPKEAKSNVSNLLELKILSFELAMHYAFAHEKDVRKAYQAMKLLYNELPSEDNQEKLQYLEGLKDLDEASEDAHHLVLYYQGQGLSDSVVKVIESMPKSMRNLPFAWAMYNRHKQPRRWEEKEICYYATYGRPHIEKWDGNSLTGGIGGSETAVIRLSEEWVRLGYKVTVYGDPAVETVINGVTYLPYFQFNPKDNFNIFINWRSGQLVGKIKAKKFLVDLHDLVSAVPFKEVEPQIDKIMVKSEYQKSLLGEFDPERIEVISNGI